jgi:small subunit ribosomal protein S20
MPRRRTSLKRNRADKKKHLRNLKIKTRLKKTIKNFQALANAKKASDAKNMLQDLFSQLDKAAKKRVIHPASCDRRKSRLAKWINRLTKA